jgi:hypothetical protein
MNNEKIEDSQRDQMVELDDESLKSLAGGCGTPTTIMGTCPQRRNGIWYLCP